MPSFARIVSPEFFSGEESIAPIEDRVATKKHPIMESNAASRI